MYVYICICIYIHINMYIYIYLYTGYPQPSRKSRNWVETNHQYVPIIGGTPKVPQRKKGWSWKHQGSTYFLKHHLFFWGKPRSKPQVLVLSAMYFPGPRYVWKGQGENQLLFLQEHSLGVAKTSDSWQSLAGYVIFKLDYFCDWFIKKLVIKYTQSYSANSRRVTIVWEILQESGAPEW